MCVLPERGPGLGVCVYIVYLLLVGFWPGIIIYCGFQIFKGMDFTSKRVSLGVKNNVDSAMVLSVLLPPPPKKLLVQPW